ncbi:type II toxin-antitoxin system CcdA family antitoxin [Azospirillum sp. 11R-A]|uniref:type II toxin-antitoxin system CcdA family antitoxin n=1 Tax=Azospirillum sp. 11R-A TaxID=3111634 RepID=UPI003C22758E
MTSDDRHDSSASEACARRKRARMTEAEKQRWTEENREAFKAYDEFVDKYGLFGDGRRLF